MTREEAIRYLDVYSSTNGSGLCTDKQHYEAKQMAIKALEQDHILDKIRAEIEQAADKQFQIAMGIADLNERYTHIQMENAYRHSLNVIDKYRESEDKE